MINIQEEIKNFSLPLKPKSFGSEYQFPEEVSNLSSIELGNWMFKLAAWKGYTLRLLAFYEIERSWLKSQHDNRVAKKIAQESDSNKKITKDHALGLLIVSGEDFRQIKEKLIIKESALEGLRQILEIYSMQIEILSREISRRSLDLKLTQRGISE
jgi:hypothetical protein